MPHIEIKKNHALGKAEARKTAEKLAESLSSEYNAKCEWVNDDLCFSSPGVKGKLCVGDEDVNSTSYGYTARRGSKAISLQAAI